MKKSILDKISDIQVEVTDKLNSKEKSFSSEKSVVFEFAWQFYKKYNEYIKNIDFETSLFNSFSDGTFLDLYLEFMDNGETYKIGLEFKFPIKKKNNTGNTEGRQKIINDIKRVTWLVEKNKIDLGVFICFTNERTYINEGNYSKAQNFRVHQDKVYKKGEELPSNDKYNERVIGIKDIRFKWSGVEKKKNKYILLNDRSYADLEPVFIYKSDLV